MSEKDRTKYYQPWGMADYDITNVNDDFHVREREDYSVVMLGPVTTGNIVAGELYRVFGSGASVSYNGVTYAETETFRGIQDVTTFSTVAGTPKVYGPGGYVLLGKN